MKHFHKACSRVCQQIMPFQKEKIAIWHWICIHFEISKTGIGERLISAGGMLLHTRRQAKKKGKEKKKKRGKKEEANKQNKT